MIFWLGKPPAPTIPLEIVRIYPLQGYWQNVLVRALNTAWPLGNCLTRKKALKTPIPCCFITLDAQGTTLILPTKPTIDEKIDLLILFWSFGISLRSQLLELDYRSPLKSESRFSIGFFKQIMLGATTLGHIDTTVEVMNIKFNPSGALLAGFSVAGTQTFWVGNKDDKRNNLSFLVNPTGRINGSLYFLIPLQGEEKSNLKAKLTFRAQIDPRHSAQGFSKFLFKQSG